MKPEDIIRRAQERLHRAFPTLQPKPERPVPEEGRLVVGRDKDGLPFALDSGLLSAHLDMVGGTGGGKSSAMRHLAWVNMETAERLNRATIIIDPHGQHEDGLFRTTLRRVVETGLYRRKKVFVIDPNSPYCTGLALLRGDAEPAVMADHMIEGFERLQGDESLLEKPTLRRALHGLLAVLSELGWSLAEADLLLDPQASDLRTWALERVRDRYARKALVRLQYLAEHVRLNKEFEVETIGTENRLAPLLSSPAMRAIVGHQVLDMRTVLDEGAVLLVNTAGHNASSEAAGDLLGKLVMRAVLFAAKRRRTASLALVFADECARYVSQDWERALAELRKYRVAICSAHQTFAMLGSPDDPVRQAIEQIPATKIAFRLNSMEEAATLAPELMKLNLEMPVEALIKETVVGHRVRRMRNASAGATQSRTQSRAQTIGDARGVTDTQGMSESENWTTTRSRQTSFQATRGRSSATGYTEQESESEGTTYQRGTARSRGGGTSEQRGTSHGANFSQSYDVPVNGRSGEAAYGDAATFGVANSRNVSAGYDSSHSRSSGSAEDWSVSETESEASSHQSSRGHARSQTTTESESVSFGVSEGVARAHGVGRSRSTSKAHSRQHSVTATLGNAGTFGDSNSRGWSETLAPILKNRPSAVHSLENVKHMAAEMLCSLPTGVAVVRTLRNGTIEGAVVRVPYRSCNPVSDDQYAADLRAVMEGSIGVPMADAIQRIAEREKAILRVACSASLPSLEPDDARAFRVPSPKPKKT